MIRYIQRSLIFSLLLACFYPSSAQMKSASPKPQLVDEFYWSGGDDANARLDLLMFEKAKVPNSRIAIFFYCGKKCYYGEPEAHFTGIRQAFAFRQWELNRESLIFGGFREKAMTELWIIPEGACIPNLSPTLATTQVSMTKSRRKVYRPYWCC